MRRWIRRIWRDSLLHRIIGTSELKDRDIYLINSQTTFKAVASPLSPTPHLPYSTSSLEATSIMNLKLYQYVIFLHLAWTLYYSMPPQFVRNLSPCCDSFTFHHCTILLCFNFVEFTFQSTFFFYFELWTVSILNYCNPVVLPFLNLHVYMYFEGLSSCNMFEISLIPTDLSFSACLLCSHFSFSVDTRSVLHTVKDLIRAHMAALSEDCIVFYEKRPDRRHIVRKLGLGFRLIMFPAPTNSSLTRSSIMFPARYFMNTLLDYKLSLMDLDHTNFGITNYDFTDASLDDNFYLMDFDFTDLNFRNLNSDIANLLTLLNELSTDYFLVTVFTYYIAFIDNFMELLILLIPFLGNEAKNRLLPESDQLMQPRSDPLTQLRMQRAAVQSRSSRQLKEEISTLPQVSASSFSTFLFTTTRPPKISIDQDINCSITCNTTIEDDDEYIFYPETIDDLSSTTLGVYKKVDKKVRPVPTTFLEDCYVQRQIPEDPLKTLIPLPHYPPEFVPTAKITEERMKVLNVNTIGFLQPEEEKLFKWIMTTNEAGIAFEDAERGTLKDSYFSPYIIPTIPHVPWVHKNQAIAPGLLERVLEVLKLKIIAGVYEQSQSSY